MSKSVLTCEACGSKATERYQLVDGRWVDWQCVPAAHRAMYPRWAGREAARSKRAAQARKNFSKKVA